MCIDCMSVITLSSWKVTDQLKSSTNVDSAEYNGLVFALGQQHIL